MDNNYVGHFKQTIVDIFIIKKIIIGLRLIVSKFMYSLGYRLIVCPYTLDTRNLYKIIFNVIAIGLQK